MFSSWSAFAIILSYLFVLFLVAYLAERFEGRGRSLVSNPYVYSLSLAVYCTSWTFYGSVGKAANSGLVFLTIYLGPTLMAALWWVVLRKIVTISKRNRITTLSDFISFRYGRSLFLSVLVTTVVVVGVTPYLGLQMKAVMTTLLILTGGPEGGEFGGWVIALLLGVFAVIFGARRLDSTERHGGLVLAVAFESAVKLLAFLTVGVFTTYFLFDGFLDIFGRIEASPYAHLLRVGEGTGVGYLEWASLTFLSMMAVLFLPRQFHVAVVENTDVAHIKTAMWLFPLYLFLINIFVLPIAMGGLLRGGAQEAADYFVLTIPLREGRPMLALFAFIGGFSAATAMVIVSSIALSTMVMNSMVVPGLLRLREEVVIYGVILNIKRLVIVGVVFLGYWFSISVGEFYSLVDIGLKSFEAGTILAPSILLGIYWKGGTGKGAAAGILGGFFVWLYTLMVPALMRAGLIAKGDLLDALFSSTVLNPTALLGLEGLDRWSHSLFWGLFVNLLLFASVSLATRQSDDEVGQAILFVDTYAPEALRRPAAPRSVSEIEDVLATYVGPAEAREAVEGYLARAGRTRSALGRDGLVALGAEAERVLSGALGPSMGALVFRRASVTTAEEKAELSESIRRISRQLRSSRNELSEANRRLALLKEFSENIIESLPLGVATLDEALRVRTWNRAMEDLTGIARAEALGANARAVFARLDPPVLGGAMPEGEFAARLREGGLMLKGRASRLTGAERGYVVVIEDVTERAKIEEELLRSSKHASIGRLAAGVSHEIGNPLASISSLVQELLSEEVSEFARASLTTVNEQVGRIARIVRNLGDFARVRPREKTPTDLAAVLEKTLSLVRYDKSFRRIAIETRVTLAEPVRVDPDQMQQVFLNLMLNARDAMPEGGAITVAIEPFGDGARIVFTDTGVGIPHDQADKVFDPFFTTKGAVRGTGLGLSICYGIVKDHDGTIEVTSAEGAGTTFTITLPG